MAIPTFSCEWTASRIGRAGDGEVQFTLTSCKCRDGLMVAGSLAECVYRGTQRVRCCESAGIYIASLTCAVPDPARLDQHAPTSASASGSTHRGQRLHWGRRAHRERGLDLSDQSGRPMFAISLARLSIAAARTVPITPSAQSLHCLHYLERYRPSEVFQTICRSQSQEQGLRPLRLHAR